MGGQLQNSFPESCKSIAGGLHQPPLGLLPAEPVRLTNCTTIAWSAPLLLKQRWGTSLLSLPILYSLSNGLGSISLFRSYLFWGHNQNFWSHRDSLWFSSTTKADAFAAIQLKSTGFLWFMGNIQAPSIPPWKNIRGNRSMGGISNGTGQVQQRNGGYQAASLNTQRTKSAPKKAKPLPLRADFIVPCKILYSDRYCILQQPLPVSRTSICTVFLCAASAPSQTVSADIPALEKSDGFNPMERRSILSVQAGASRR